MSDKLHPTDLDFAALMSSKICHDIIGPVGAIYNGIEILDEDRDPQAQSYALEIIRNVTAQTSTRLQFARIAFGAAGSAGSTIDLRSAREISEGYVSIGKHRLHWRGPDGQMVKNRAKLLLNLVSAAISALPRGGDIDLAIGGSLEQPHFLLRCRGNGARPPQFLADFVSGKASGPLDANSIQAYYTWRLSAETGMPLAIRKDGADILIEARALR